MNRDQKSLVIKSLKDGFINNQASFLIGYKGLTVNQMQILRRELRSKGGRLKVAKARLMKRAAQGIEGVEQLTSYFKDQIGLVFADQEPPAVAKVLYDFSKNNEALHLVVGYFEEQVLDGQAIVRIASLPPREVLLAQLCGSLRAPTSNLVRLLNMLVIRLLFVLKQIGEKK